MPKSDDEIRILHSKHIETTKNFSLFQAFYDGHRLAESEKESEIALLSSSNLLTETINKIHNIDCLQGFKLIKDKAVDLILTDIPYDVVNRDSNGLRDLDKKNADIIKFDLTSFLNECIRVCKGSIYIFCGTEQVSYIRETLVKADLSTRLIIWEKTNPSPMNGEYIWLSGIEVCIFGKFSRASINTRFGLSFLSG